MNKIEFLTFLIIFFIIAILKCTLPMYNSLYSNPDKFKDSDNNFYLAKYDSYHHYGKINRGNIDNAYLYMGKFIYDIFGVKGLFWIPVVFGLLSWIMFYFLVRHFFPFWPTFFASLFFAVHPSSFFTSAKGIFDTEFLIQFCEILVIFVIYMALTKNKYYALLFIPIFVFVTTFWRGAPIFLGLVCLLTLFILFINFKRFHRFSLALILFSVVISYLGVRWYFQDNVILTNQLQPYNLLCIFDIILLPLIFTLMLYFFLKSSDRKDKIDTYFIFSGFCLFAILGFLFMRFYYFAIPFMALGVGYLVYKLKNGFLLGCTIILFTLILSNLNQPLIVVEDSVVNAMEAFDSSDSEELITLWDFGNIYYGLSNKKILNRAAPNNIEKFSKGMFYKPDLAISYLDSIATRNYTLVINSRDYAKFPVIATLLNITINESSMYHHLDTYFDVYFNETGVMTNMTLYKRKAYIV